MQCSIEVRVAGPPGLSMDGPAAYLWALGRLSVRGQRSPFAVSIRGSWLRARDRAQVRTATNVGGPPTDSALHWGALAAPQATGGAWWWASSLRATTFAALSRASSHARLRPSAGGERISAPAICSVAARLIPGAASSPGSSTILYLHRPNE